MKKSALAISMALILASTAVFAEATQNDAKNAIFDAVTANNKVAKMGFEWRDTYKNLLGPAKQAYKKGDYETAIKMANSAKEHAELGMVQAKAGMNASLNK